MRANKLLIFICLLGQSTLAAKMPNNQQLERIEAVNTFLERFHDACGRYPLSKEGLNALIVPPTDVSCKKDWKKQSEDRYLNAMLNESTDLIYSSKDGSSFMLAPKPIAK